MKTETANLIDSLCVDVAPVRRVWDPSLRFVLWFSITLCYSLVLIVLVGSFRPAVFEQLLLYPRLLIESCIGMLAGIVAGYAAFESMVPGIRWDLKKKLLILLPAIIFALLSIYGIFNPILLPSWSGWRPGCELEILAYGTLPVLLCFILALRSAPTNSGWTGFLIGLAAFTPAMVGINLACAYDPIHIVFFHLLPVGILGIACACFGRSFFKV